MIDKNQRDALIDQAREARENAYAPYSHFCVGAALLTSGGNVYLGCNVENVSFTPTCCAERVAFFSAIAEKERDFSAIAIVGNTHRCMPCGVCRQVMAEFCHKDFVVIWGNGEKITTKTLGEILPCGFDKSNL